MPYADKTYMINRYTQTALIELTDHAEPVTSAIVDAVLDSALTDADGVVDSYIGARYQLPLAAVPVVIKSAAAAIAYYFLHRDRYPDEVREAYKDALSFLRDISQGKANLDVAGVEPASSQADARVEGPERIFSRESLKGF